MCTAVKKCRAVRAGSGVGKNTDENPKLDSKMCNSITKTIHFAHLGILFVYAAIFAENRGGSVCGSCSDLISALTLTTVFSAPSPPSPPVIVFSRSSNRLLAALSLTQLVVFTVLDQQPGK